MLPTLLADDQRSCERVGLGHDEYDVYHSAGHVTAYAGCESKRELQGDGRCSIRASSYVFVSSLIRSARERMSMCKGVYW